MVSLQSDKLKTKNNYLQHSQQILLQLLDFLETSDKYFNKLIETEVIFEIFENCQGEILMF